MASPAVMPRNILAQYMERIQEVNATAGKPAGRSYAGAVSATPEPSVRSADMLVEPAPLSPEEVADRDAKARALGILPPADDELEGHEAALALGAPVPRPASRTVEAGMLNQDRLTAREFIGASRHGGAVLPNFENVQVFDVQRGVVVIDGMEFDIPQQEIAEMKAWAVTLALDAVVLRLARALQAFGLPKEMIEVATERLREGVHGKDTTGTGGAVPAVRVGGHLQGEPDSGSEAVQVLRGDTQRPVEGVQPGPEAAHGSSTGSGPAGDGAPTQG